MESKRSVLSSAFFFFNKFSRRRLSVSPSPLMPGKMAAETDQNHVNSGYDISSVHDLDHAHVLFDQMLSSRPLPCIILFNRLLSRIVKMKHYWAVVSIFKEMLIRGIPVDTYTLNILIDAFCRSNRVDCGFCVIGMFFKSGIGFSAVTYNTLIKTLCLNDKIAEAVELFRMFVRDNSCEVDNLTCNILMNGLCKAGNTQTALDLLTVLQKEGPKPDNVAYNTVIDSLCKDGMVDQALDLLPQMTERGVSPNIVTYTSLIQGLCHFCRWKDVTKLIDEMARHNLYPNTRTFNILVGAFCKEGKLKDAKSVIQIMIQRNTYPDVITYNNFIEGYFLQGQMDEARRAFDQMVEEGIQPDRASYTTLINGYCKRKAMDEAMHLFLEMQEKGICPDVVTYTAVLQGLFLVGQFDDALNIFQNMQLSGHAPNFHTYCVLLTGLCDNGHIGKAMSVYSKLSSNESGSHVFGSIIIDGLCKMGLLNIARGILSNLFFKGQYLNKYTYTAMMNGLCQGGFVHKALELLRRMGEIGCEPDSITYNVILQEFVRAKKLDEILLPNA
ncbi:unnamed protein product [Cuscuta campestris]|uniref:Pentacotripeptide-repeat region of PRORP domain-containing protein n=1 Tax=Cuscuta campestris TaxID=132261 RepID=A0A484MW77_9ASTE|nr:unnamed protein product [Cuscuta campestris]